MKEIEITVSKTGETKVKTRGFAGSSCKAETAEFEKLLGKKTSDVATSEVFGGQANRVVNQG
jgi:hypothetical protein